MDRSSYIDLEALIQQWAKDRQIIPNSSPVAQARKTLEEAGELLEAAARMHAFINSWEGEIEQYEGAKDDYRDAIGDVMVTLIIGAALANVDVLNCLLKAYDTIKDRKGYLRADGIFVKES